MTKLVALYKKPADPDSFDKHYIDVHLPLMRQFPGLLRLEVTRTTGAPLGEAKFYLMTEIYFENKDVMDAALYSPAGKAVARDMMGFAADVAAVFHGEVEA